MDNERITCGLDTGFDERIRMKKIPFIRFHAAGKINRKLANATNGILVNQIITINQALMIKSFFVDVTKIDSSGVIS